MEAIAHGVASAFRVSTFRSMHLIAALTADLFLHELTIRFLLVGAPVPDIAYPSRS
jgi:hypothetical protein